MILNHLKYALAALITISVYSLWGYNAPLFSCYTARPNVFYSEQFEISASLGWFIFYAEAYLIVLLYINYVKSVGNKSTIVKGLVFGIATMILTSFIIASLNAITGAPKEDDILLKTFSYLVAHLFSSIALAYSIELLFKESHDSKDVELS